MTGPENDQNVDDAELRAALARGTGKPSAAHDAAILAAADSVAAGIRGRRARRWIVPAAMAASLALVGVWSVSWFRADQNPDTMRGIPAGTAVSPVDGAKLDAAPSKLEWRSVPGASSYEVTLRDSQGAVLGVLQTSEPVANLSQLTTLRFNPGTYFWTVRSRGPALDSELGPFSFQLAAER